VELGEHAGGSMKEPDEDPLPSQHALKRARYRLDTAEGAKAAPRRFPETAADTVKDEL
ncbi:hypothetical protein BDFG_03803, partial [Blastomyces dermatitidis ATCC 26199]